MDSEMSSSSAWIWPIAARGNPQLKPAPQRVACSAQLAYLATGPPSPEPQPCGQLDSRPYRNASTFPVRSQSGLALCRQAHMKYFRQLIAAAIVLEGKTRRSSQSRPSAPGEFARRLHREVTVVAVLER
jgi:hypothetical protein